MCFSIVRPNLSQIVIVHCLGLSPWGKGFLKHSEKIADPNMSQSVSQWKNSQGWSKLREVRGKTEFCLQNNKTIGCT